MANYTELKAAINTAIKQNGNQEITGVILNNVLNSIVNSFGANYMFAGVAQPNTNPGTPDQNVFYLAFKAGTYVNFGNVELPVGISLLVWNGEWAVNTYFTVDAVPTSNSNNPVMSGGVKSIINNIIRQFRGLGTGASDAVAYYRGLDPVFFCGTFSLAYHGEYAEAIMNAELDKLHDPSGSSSGTYECNALETELHGVSRPIPGGLCHISIYGSHIWFINNVRSYIEDLWVQVFFNAKIGLVRYEEDGEIKTKKGLFPGQNIIARTRIKANDSDEMCTLWSDFYEIPFNIMEKLFPSDPQNSSNANHLTETGFRSYVNFNIPVESGMTWGSLAVRRASTADANGFIAVEQTFYARDGNHIGKSWRRLGLIDSQGTITFFNWYE